MTAGLEMDRALKRIGDGVGKRQLFEQAADEIGLIMFVGVGRLGIKTLRNSRKIDHHHTTPLEQNDAKNSNRSRDLVRIG